ncbi:MAG TPA: SpoIIE family protein phosphatase [Streptosporangiaceae bacterium]|nr:SpoIIE family protein phosphatase [Streptosporangiaceae bacterium]
MTQTVGQSHQPEGEWAALKERRDRLRQAASIPDAQLRPALDAALNELDAALDALATALGSGGSPGDTPPTSQAHAERRLLHAQFTDAPVPLLLLEPDGTVRRINRAAAALLGTGTAYGTGKPFTAFVNLASRAAVDSQLAATRRTGAPGHVRCEVLTGEGTRECDLTAGLARLQGDTDHLVLAIAEVAAAPDGGAVPAKAGRGKSRKAATRATPAKSALTANTRRLDLVTTVTRLLLENATQNEAVTLQRCVRFLADEFAAWVVVDMLRGNQLRRQFVAGPQEERAADLASQVASCDPGEGTVPHTVADTGSAQIIAHVEDTAMLGDGPGGVPLLMLMGATSVLSVPVAEGDRTYGALTLARPAREGPFRLADLGLLEGLAEQLALAVAVGRTVSRHTEVTTTLRDSLLPPVLPDVPGVDLAALHLAASGPRLRGDFYDVYQTPDGWAVSIGDACGEGPNDAAVAAAARQAIRVVGRSAADPAAVLTGANEILAADGPAGGFVTACVAHLRWQGPGLHVSLSCAGHPGPVLARQDGSALHLPGGGLPLGLFGDAELGVGEQDLSPGDTLVLFTDGLANARNREAGAFGDRLTGEVAAVAERPPGEILARLQEVALEFCRGDIRDDITMLALRMGEEP